MHKILFIFLAVSIFTNAFSHSILAQKKRLPKNNLPPKVSNESIQRSAKIRLEAFNQVWGTINELYFDQTFNGLDWNKIRLEYTNKLKTIKTDLELHELLQEMINRLNRSHFFIIPPEAYKEIEEAKSESKRKELQKQNSEQGVDKSAEKTEETDLSGEFDHFGLAIDIRILDNQVVITNVEKDSNAEKAGLKRGFVIEKINGISLKDLMFRLQNYNAYSKTLKNQMPGVLLSILEGEENSEIEITYLDDKDAENIKIIKRQGLQGELVNIIKNIPAQLLRFESKSIDENIGYIKFNFFAFPVLNKFCSAVSDLKSKDAIIIDMRGNSGGAFGVLLGISGLLTDKILTVGTQISKNGKNPLLIRPMMKNFKGKIIILVDGQSISAAEIFAAAMQENGRAVVIGEKSAGEALPSYTKILPTGAIFLYPIANFQTPKGKFLEGKGVEPDFQIPLNRNSLILGTDNQLEAAIKYIKINQKVTPTPKPIEISDAAMPLQVKIPKPVAGLQSAQNSPVKVEKKHDEAALNILKEYITAIGGEEVLRNISSYSAFGSVELTEPGSIIGGDFEMHRKTPNFSAEIMTLDSIGQIREVFDGKNFFVQALYTGVVEETKQALIGEYKLFAEFNEFLNFTELYPKIKFLGVFERQGRKINLIEATSNDGIKFAFVFDAETKFLTSRSGQNFEATFEGYKKTGNLLFPMKQTRNTSMKILINEVKFNSIIDDKKFLKENNCFTQID